MATSASDSGGRTPHDATRNLTIVQAMREAVCEEMRRNPDVFIIGEDVQIGGSFLFTLGMVDEFGPDRIINTPISEAGFVGLAIGAAIRGMRPVVDFQYGDFIFTAMDQVVQQGAKLSYMSGGQVDVPVVLHLPTGASGRGAQHANPIESFFFGVPGLKIVTPSSPYDAKGLLKASLRDKSMVLFCVHKHLYGSKGRQLDHSETSTGHVPEEEYLIPFGKADIKRSGSDVTVVANSLMLHRCLEVAAELADEGVEVEVIDPRTLVPFDLDAVVQSVSATGRLVIVEENHSRGGWGGHVITCIAGMPIGTMRAPIRRVTLPDLPIPYSPALEDSMVPSHAKIRDAIVETVRS